MPLAKMKSVGQIHLPILSALKGSRSVNLPYSQIRIQIHTQTRSITVRTAIVESTKDNDRIEKHDTVRESHRKQYPLSKLPTGMLLRSMLVSTVSSCRFLLNPSLSILSWLSKPGNSALFNVDRNPLLHGILRQTFYDQFCAGENPREAKRCVQELRSLGFRGVILTFAKETTHDHNSSTPDIVTGTAQDSIEKTHDMEIAEWTKGTLETVDILGEGDILALKMTGAGPAVTAAFTAGELPPQQMRDALDEIGRRCKERQVRIIVDAESQHFQKGIARVTLELMKKFNRDGYAVVYNTYQAYLKSTPANLAHHLAEANKDKFTLGLKLVRGAYMAFDDRALIHDSKEETDQAYNNIALGAVRRVIGDFGEGGLYPFPSVNLFLASHNRHSVMEAQKMHQLRTQSGLPTVPIAFAQLHGMSDEVSFSLLSSAKERPHVFKCSTWGSMSQCIAYLVRRAVENKDAVGRTTDELYALRSEFRRRLRSFITKTE